MAWDFVGNRNDYSKKFNVVAIEVEKTFRTLKCLTISIEEYRIPKTIYRLPFSKLIAIPKLI